MDRKKLDKIKRKVSRLRKKICNVSSREVVSLVKSLGRERRDRGKEPTWESTVFLDLRPISIPHRGTLNNITAGKILDQLEQDDISRFEATLNDAGDRRA